VQEIHVVVTMDCEPLRPPERQGAATSGPASLELSERAIQGYVAIAGERGWPVSFFVHPEAALAQPRLYLELAEAGHDLGLHIHPYKHDPVRFRSHFGALSAERQRVLLAEGSALWAHALGRRPTLFRPGTFSANDSTFPVLEEMGFLGGSISCPGRNYPDLYAVWSGAPVDPHRGHRTFRLLPGDLDFVNLPLSVDLSRLEERNGRHFHWDLRPDYLSADYPTIARNMVGQLQERRPAVPVLMLVTHNDHDYLDETDRVCRNYRASLAAMAQACEEAGLQAVGSTVETVCRLVRERVPPDRSFVLGHASLQTG
jgi:hypothetical protein